MNDINRTESRPEYDDVARALGRLLVERGLRQGERTVVGVAGESGSGKSVTAAGLARVLSAGGFPALVLHQDDYFHLPPRANHLARERDIGRVGPGEVNLALMQSHIAAFRDGCDELVGPSVNYPADRFDTRRIALRSASVLIVEGTYVLGLEHLDTRIFLEASFLDTLPRRRERARDVDSPFVERVVALEHQIVVRQAALADLLVDAHFAVRSAVS